MGLAIASRHYFCVPTESVLTRTLIKLYIRLNYLNNRTYRVTSIVVITKRKTNMNTCETNMDPLDSDTKVTCEM